MEIYDMHCHLNEFKDDELETIFNKDIKVVAVSEDIKSLTRILEISKIYPKNVIPCGGFHPWMIRDGNTEEVKDIIRIIQREGLNCIGEVGIDKRFLDETTYKKQEDIFLSFIKLSKEINAMLNIHAPNAWSDVLKLLKENEIEKAMFHWYSGPTSLIKEIKNSGYFISWNVALIVQTKHQSIIKETPLDIAVLESDGPYNYHGIKLSPLMIYDLISFISEKTGINRELIIKTTSKNSKYLLNIS